MLGNGCGLNERITDAGLCVLLIWPAPNGAAYLACLQITEAVLVPPHLLPRADHAPLPAACSMLVQTRCMASTRCETRSRQDNRVAVCPRAACCGRPRRLIRPTVPPTAALCLLLPSSRTWSVRPKRDIVPTMVCAVRRHYGVYSDRGEARQHPAPAHDRPRRPGCTSKTGLCCYLDLWQHWPRGCSALAAEQVAAWQGITAIAPSG